MSLEVTEQGMQSTESVIDMKLNCIERVKVVFSETLEIGATRENKIGQLKTLKLFKIKHGYTVILNIKKHTTVYCYHTGLDFKGYRASNIL